MVVGKIQLKRILTAVVLLIQTAVLAQKEVYELRTYELEFFKSDELLLNYFEDALIPALNKQGVKHVGVFEETAQALPRKIYVLIPYNSIEDYVVSFENLTKDEEYQQNGEKYLNAGESEIPFDRYDTNLIRSTLGFPELRKPKEGLDVLELRIYNSHNEDALRRKVKMFQSEFNIFNDAGLEMVFFGYNIAGSQMPCLTYLLAVESMEAHAIGWSNFLQHPDWKTLVAEEEYAQSMNEITRVFLKPLAISQL
ncbi:hypothetical protein GCM10011414_15200 [Croceivirga lutea]|uniref:NIPSNAP family protein n=1 Tax=Croceivirga lutea TaxID=1775167 RepID=UPI00163AE967|nr:NIPSNAP family protein [Croceivirga lutea]GGG46512.1 hypothetical protein GCM10011414_15200 [Croceivirga lutea]